MGRSERGVTGHFRGLPATKAEPEFNPEDIPDHSNRGSSAADLTCVLHKSQGHEGQVEAEVLLHIQGNFLNDMEITTQFWIGFLN